MTAILTVLLIYRSLVSMREDDQLFLDAAQTNLEQEQQHVRKRLERLAPYTIVLSAASGVLLAAIASIWVYRQFADPALLSQ